jgi:hypothetical protein
MCYIISRRFGSEWRARAYQYQSSISSKVGQGELMMQLHLAVLVGAVAFNIISSFDDSTLHVS